MDRDRENHAAATLRFAYLLSLPPAAIWILHQQGWRISAWITFVAAIAIFITIYLRSALIKTESENPKQKRAWLPCAGVVLLVGIAALFDWRRWIVEQLLLEIAAFSTAIAYVAVRKAADEGGILQGPWFMVVVMFVLPTIGLITICAKALLFSAGETWNYLMLVPLVAAFGIAAFDSARKLIPYTLGNQQLDEPFGSRIGIVLLIIWFVALLVGMPLLLSAKAAA